jgi:hypothetical protein
MALASTCFSALLGAAEALSPSGRLLLTVAPNTAQIGANLVPNPSFEEEQGAVPRAWVWNRRNTDAAFALAPEGRSGGRCARVTNGTPLAPHVYGQLLLAEPLALTPGETYTLSFYARSESPGPAWVGGGDGWWVRCGLRNTGGRWQRFSLTFSARDGDAHFPLMINTDGPTPGFDVDDVKLESGPVATPIAGVTAAQPLELLVDLPDSLGGPADRLAMALFVSAAVPVAAARLEARLLGEDQAVLGEAAVTLDLSTGVHGVSLDWAVGQLARQMVRLEISLTAPGQAPLLATASFELLTATAFARAEAETRQAAATLAEHLAEARARGLALRAARVAQVTLERFLPLARRKWDLRRAGTAFADLDFLAALARDADLGVLAVLAGTAPDDPVPEPDLSRLAIANGSLHVDGEPVVIVGAMGYGELEEALPRQADWGFNTVGDDWNNGYSCISMMTGPGTHNADAVPRLGQSWDRLHALNLAVSFNPTLHYFPEWALKQHVDITGGDPVDCLPDWSGLGRHAGKHTKTYGSFFPFAIDSPSLRDLVRDYYAALFPGLKDHPGRQLVWLMNEPTYSSSDAGYMELYRRYLLTKFGSLERLNAAWGSAYARSEEVQRPERRDSPEQFDWLSFHQDQVASWFEWLAAEARRHAPDLFLSNKPMAWTILQPEQGIDWEREALLWDVPGCDAGRAPGHWRYAFGWREAAFCFDFQKSVTPDKPLGDFEYHYVHEPGVSAEYARATYWHSALHGLRWSNFWVWATGQLGEGPAGAGMTDTAWSQPRIAWGTATAALELRRLAREVAAFPGQAEVRLYFGRASLYRDASVYPGALVAAYEAANGLDAPVGFVTDRMVRAGALAETRLLVVPAARHVEADVLATIRRYAAAGGRVLLLGECLTVDPYDRPHADTLPIDGDRVTAMATGLAESLVPVLDSALAAAEVARPVRALLADGRPAWPAECRSATVDGRRVVALVGLDKTVVDITLVSDPPIRRWTDLIRGGRGEGNHLTVKPLDVFLLAVE